MQVTTEKKEYITPCVSGEDSKELSPFPLAVAAGVMAGYAVGRGITQAIEVRALLQQTFLPQTEAC